MLISGGQHGRSKMIDPYQPRARVVSRNGSAKREIRKFLLALYSYPDCAAANPDLTFQQYLCSVLTEKAQEESVRHHPHDAKVPEFRFKLQPKSGGFRVQNPSARDASPAAKPEDRS